MSDYEIRYRKKKVEQYGPMYLSITEEEAQHKLWCFRKLNRDVKEAWLVRLPWEERVA